MAIDTTLSLTQLENEDWGDAPADATTLVSTVHRLRRTPLDELEAGDLRMLLGQQISPQILVPLVLPLLSENPALEATFYPGDLLSAVLRLPESYWDAHPPHRAEVMRIAAAAKLPDLDEEVAGEIAAFGVVRGQ